MSLNVMASTAARDPAPRLTFVRSRTVENVARSDSWCALADAGRRVCESAQSSIQATEEGLLTVLAPAGRAGSSTRCGCCRPHPSGTCWPGTDGHISAHRVGSNACRYRWGVVWLIRVKCTGRFCG